jgi:hypothetical protein
VVPSVYSFSPQYSLLPCLPSLNQQGESSHSHVLNLPDFPFCCISCVFIWKIFFSLFWRAYVTRLGLQDILG